MAQAKKKVVEKKSAKATKAAEKKAAFIKGEIVALRKIEKPSSMAFIRETISKDHSVSLEDLIKLVSKAGYATKESSIRQEWLKARRSLKKKNGKEKEAE